MAKAVALTGGAYQAHSVISSAQRSLNLYGEPMPRDQGEPAPVAHYPTPGSSLVTTIGSGPIRGIRQASNGGVFVVSGSDVYSVGAGDTSTLLGSITPGLTTPVSMADNGLDLIIVDGSANGWDVNLAANTMTTIPTSTPLTPFPATSTVAITADQDRYSPFRPVVDGSIVSATVTLAAGYTGNLKCSVFSDSGNRPADLLGSANNIVNPATGANALTFGTPIAVSRGTQYWIGWVSDTSSGTWSIAAFGTGGAGTTGYANFPETSPPVALAEGIECSITTSNDPGGMFAGADRVDYLDTFFLFNKPGTPQFYWSGSLATTFDTLDFANKESASDYLVTLIVSRREIYLLGTQTTEIWYDAGGSFSTTDYTSVALSSQFQSVQGVFIDHGIAAKYSIANYDNAIFWLARNRQGDGMVMTSAGYRTDRISTYAIETAFKGYSRIDDAIGWTYQINGHTFYVLTFPTADHTWVYGTGTKLWHEWGWIDTNGAEHRHRANCFATVNGQLVVGDWQNGSLYALGTDVYTDQNGAVTGPIKRQRSFPHAVGEGRRIFWREFVADMETGTAPKLGPVPDNLLVSLDWSDDRGHSYGSPVAQAIGGTSPTLGAGGDYLTSMQWQRLGMTRDRVWRLTWTVNAPTVLQGAWVTAEVADADQPAQAAAG